MLTYRDGGRETVKSTYKPTYLLACFKILLTITLIEARLPKFHMSILIKI